MKWFRMYHSITDSLKVRTLSTDAQLDYFYLLCCASEFRERHAINSGETGLTVPEAAWRTRRTTLEGTFPTLFQAGLAHLDEDQKIVINDWEEKQFASDDVAARTLKHKEKKRGNVPVNVGVNVREVEVDTETTTAPLALVPRKRGEGPPPCQYQAVIDLYHEILPANPACGRRLPSGRAKAIQTRWKDGWEMRKERGASTDAAGILEGFRTYFGIAATSKFLRGMCDPSPGRSRFIADIDFLMREKTFTNVLEHKTYFDEEAAA